MVMEAIWLSIQVLVILFFIVLVSCVIKKKVRVCKYAFY